MLENIHYDDANTPLLDAASLTASVVGMGAKGPSFQAAWRNAESVTLFSTGFGFLAASDGRQFFCVSGFKPT
ncbi:MAG: hypothetical protein MUC91_10005 [Verrucomicrobia bacterium]|nr:hypothetical protein [Verrucomicrobiota bacterium]